MPIGATCMLCGVIRPCSQVEGVGFVCSDCRPSMMPRNCDRVFENLARDLALDRMPKRNNH